MESEEPAYLEVGTEISAKFKGAFCEARVKRVQKSVKCKVGWHIRKGRWGSLDGDGAVRLKVALKEAPFGNVVVEEREVVKGEAAVGAEVVVPVSAAGKTSARGAVVAVKDSSLYTVLFDDGDERELRRTQICPKGLPPLPHSVLQHRTCQRELGRGEALC